MSDLSLAITFKVVDEASKEFKRLSGEFGKLKSDWEKLGFGIGTALRVGGLAAATGLAALTKNAINSADEIGKAAQKIGISTESLSGLAYAAGLSDVSMDQLKTGFIQLNKSIVESRDPASEAANAFKYLGVETKNADGSARKADDVFKDVADRFSKMPDGINKTALAVEIFGKSGADLIPMLNAGKDGLEKMRLEAEKLGLIVSTETAKSAEEFNDSITRMGNAVTGVGLSIAKEVLPTLNKLAAELIDNVKNGEGFKSFASGVAQVFKILVAVGAGVIWTFNRIGRGIGALAAAGVELLSGNLEGAVNVLREYRDESSKSAEETGAFINKLWEEGDATTDTANKLKALTNAKGDYTKVNKQAQKEAEKLKQQYDSLMQSLQKQISGYDQLTQAQKTEIDLADKKFAKLSAADRAAALVRAKAVDDITNQKTYQDAYNQAIEQWRQKNDAVSDSLQEIDRYLRNLIEKGPEQADAIRKVDSEYATLTDRVRILQRELERLQLDPAKNQARIDAIRSEVAGLEAAIGVNRSYKDTLVAGNVEIAKRNKEADYYRSVIADTSQRIRDLAAQEELLWKWLSEGAISAAAFVEAMNKLDAEKLEIAKSKLSDIEKKVASIARTTEDAFSNVFYNAMQGQFDNIFVLFKQMLDRMVAEALAANLAKMLFGNYGTTGRASGSGADFFTALAGFFGFREQGGPVVAGQPYIVGERRPEVFVPKQNGHILPSVDALAGMSSGGNHLNVSITAMDSQSVIGALDKVKRQASQMFTDTRRTYNMAG